MSESSRHSDMPPTPPPTVIFTEAHLTDADLALADDVLARLRALNGHLLRAPIPGEHRRRHAKAALLRGSNSIEGYDITSRQALDVLAHRPLVGTSDALAAEIEGYRQAHDFLAAAYADPTFPTDETAIRAAHRLLLAHDPYRSPGAYRTGDIHVVDDRDGEIAYTGPDAVHVPALMKLIGVTQDGRPDSHPLVAAALTHLNLVMVHPFRDGNGRIARLLHTALLARRTDLPAELVGAEDWLAQHRDDYYRILALTGEGHWHPENSTLTWTRFMIRAHHLQAQWLAHQGARDVRLGEVLDMDIDAAHLDSRVLPTLLRAGLGETITRADHARDADLEDRTAARDLTALTSAGWLAASGATKSRTYSAGERLLARVARVSEPFTPEDPYPGLRDDLLRSTAVRHRRPPAPYA